MTTRLSLTTILRRAVADLASASAEMCALAERSDNLVITTHSIADAKMPVTVMAIEQDERVGGMGDRRRAIVRLVCCAVGENAHDVAEQMTEICRDTITGTALAAYGINGEVLLDFPLVDFSRRELDPIELVGDAPEQFASKEIVFAVTASVLIPTAVA